MKSTQWLEERILNPVLKIPGELCRSSKGKESLWNHFYCREKSQGNIECLKTKSSEAHDVFSLSENFKFIMYITIIVMINSK